MVNRGGPSKACQECRRRKIRCDLRRPECSQCTRVGKRCPGYRNLDDLIFRPYQSNEGEGSSRSETSASQPSGGQASTAREEPGYLAVPTSETYDISSVEASSRRERATSFVVSQGSLASTSHGKTSPFSFRYLGPASWEQQAIACFMGQFTYRSVGSTSSFGWFDFLPDLYSGCDEDSCLQPAVMAISYTSLAGQSSLRWLETEARRFYGLAISKINAAIQSNETAVQDDVLASVLLAGLYENYVGDNLDVMGSHREGLNMLVKMRGSVNFETDRGRSLFRHVRSMYRIFTFQSGTRPVSIVEEHAYPLEQHAYPKSPGSPQSSSLATLSNKVADYLARFKSFYVSPNSHSTENYALGLSNFLAQAEGLQAELDGWGTSDNGSWRGSRYESIPGIAKGPQPPYLLTYSDTWVGTSATLCRTQYLHLWETMFLCYEALENPDAPLFPRPPLATSEPAKHCIEQARGRVEEICASVPFLLDDVDSSANIAVDQAKSGIKAYISIWGLWIAKSSALAEESQTKYVDEALARIGGMWGMQMATLVSRVPNNDRFGVMARSDYL